MVTPESSHEHTKPAVQCPLRSKSLLIIRDSSSFDCAKPLACWRMRHATRTRNHCCVWRMATPSLTSLTRSPQDLVKLVGGTSSMRLYRMIWSVTAVFSNGVITRRTVGEVMNMVRALDMGQVWLIQFTECFPDQLRFTKVQTLSQLPGGILWLRGCRSDQHGRTFAKFYF